LCNKARKEAQIVENKKALSRKMQRFVNYFNSEEYQKNN
jgi:hypothetical protein